MDYRQADMSRFSTRLSIFLVLLLVPPASFAELNSYEATYQLSSLYVNQADATNTLIIKDKTYHLSSEIQPTSWIGLVNHSNRSEQSLGFIQEDIVQPKEYIYQHKNWVGNQRRIKIQFDYKNKTITNEHLHIDNKWKMSLFDNVQDRLSTLLSLMLTLQKSKPDNDQQKFFYQVADGGRLKQYSFQILAEEQIKTPIGVLNTIKLKHWRANQKGWKIIWCAEEFAYMPVKIIQQQSGLPDYESIITSYKKIINN